MRACVQLEFVPATPPPAKGPPFMCTYKLKGKLADFEVAAFIGLLL